MSSKTLLLRKVLLAIKALLPAAWGIAVRRCRCLASCGTVQSFVQSKVIIEIIVYNMLKYVKSCNSNGLGLKLVDIITTHSMTELV